MCLALNYLHQQSITHRDLKPENVLLQLPDTNETLIKITDFGLSRFISEQSMMKTFCGTPNYLAPEVLESRGEGSYTNKVDVWSLGVILYICLVGYPPFSDSPDLPPLSDQILKGSYTFPDEYWSGISDEAKNLIQKMMCIDPIQRLSMSQVLEDPWLANDNENRMKVERLMFPATTASNGATTTTTTTTTTAAAAAPMKRKVDVDFDDKTSELPTSKVEKKCKNGVVNE